MNDDKRMELEHASDNLIQFPVAKAQGDASIGNRGGAKIIGFPTASEPDERIEELFTLSFEEVVERFDNDEMSEWMRHMCGPNGSRHHRTLVAFVANSPHGAFETEMATSILCHLSQNPDLHTEEINTILNLSIAHDFDYEWQLASCENLSLNQVSRLTRIACEREVAVADKDERREKDRPFSDILFFLAHNPSLDPEALTIVVEAVDDDLVVLEQVLNNPNMDETVMRAVPGELMELLDLRKVEALTALACAGTNDEAWDTFHPGYSAELDLAVVYNRSTPGWILRSLLRLHGEHSALMSSLLRKGYYENGVGDVDFL